MWTKKCFLCFLKCTTDILNKHIRKKLTTFFCVGVMSSEANIVFITVLCFNCNWRFLAQYILMYSIKMEARKYGLVLFLQANGNKMLIVKIQTCYLVGLRRRTVLVKLLFNYRLKSIYGEHPFPVNCYWWRFSDFFPDFQT